jgi:hypothetical protein
VNDKEIKLEIQRITSKAIRNFISQHPGELDKKWILSLSKRVAGQIWTHFWNNKKEK